jgi:hypothetical protein
MGLLIVDCGLSIVKSVQHKSVQHRGRKAQTSILGAAVRFSINNQIEVDDFLDALALAADQDSRHGVGGFTGFG